MKVTKGKKKYRREVQKLSWERDENTVGPDPPVSLLVSKLSPLTTVQEVILQFRTFGELAETKLQIDPSNGASLGLCRVVYRKNPKNFEAAIEAAKKALKSMHGNKLGGVIINVEVDDDGALCDLKFKELVNEREEARAASASAAKAHTIASTSVSLSTEPTGPRTSQREDAPQREHHDREPRDDRYRSESKKYGRESAYKARDTSKISNSTSETNKRLGDLAYIFIPGKYLPLHKVTAQDLQIHFSGKKNRDIFTDHYGFYVLFDDDERAVHAHKTMDKSTFLGYRLYMELHKAKKPAATIHQKPLGGAFKKTFQPVKTVRDPIMETTNRVIKELQEVFLRDIRSRIAGPALLEFLDPANFRASINNTAPEPSTEVPNGGAKPDIAVENAKLGTDLTESRAKKLADVLMNIPRRKKTKTADKDVGRMQLSHRMDHHTVCSDASDASDDDSREVRSDRPSSIAASVDFEEDGNNTPMRQMKTKVTARKLIQKKVIKDLSSESDSADIMGDRSPPESQAADKTLEINVLIQNGSVQNGDYSPLVRRHEVDFTSSSEDEAPSGLMDTKVLKTATAPAPAATMSNDNLKNPISTATLVDELTHVAATDASEQDDAKPRKSKTKKSKRRPFIEKKNKKLVAPPVVPQATYESSAEQSSSDEEVQEPDAVNIGATADEDEVVLDLDGIQSIVKDAEDYHFLTEILRDVHPAKIKDIFLWSWQQKETKAAHADGVKGVTKQLKDTGYNRVNETGSAKTEGWYAIPDIEKSYYLPNRNRAVASEPGLVNTSSRMNRANNRRQAAGIEAQRQTLDAQTDLLRFNALKSRKKQLKFSRSAIHDWGLYALEPIERGEMVIEYVGEIIRQQVADHREKRYERQGIGSSYLFRIDEELVIDATKSGNIARFINHSCDPSCTAKIITVYGQKKIVIYAQRDIALGEEITYDYKFPLEDEKIPCLCGSVICRKYLN